MPTEGERDPGGHYERAFLWPDVPRKVFQAGPPHRTASLAPGQFDFLAAFSYRRAYEEAVHVLHRHVESAGRPHHVLLPLAFLWRHLIEILLKEVIRSSRELFFEDLTVPEERALVRHDLTQLWLLAKDHIRLLGPTDGPPCSIVGEVLLEIQEVDPGADGFRYPFKRDGSTATLSAAPEDVDVTHLHETMTMVFNFLDACVTEIAARADFFSDYEGSMANEYGWPDAEELGRARRAYAETCKGVPVAGAPFANAMAGLLAVRPSSAAQDHDADPFDPKV